MRWDSGYDGAAMLRELAVEITGHDPGPLQHQCPTCGSIEHGVPRLGADLAVSIARADGLTVVALGNPGGLGVDVAQAGPSASEWVRTEAVAKAHGTGIVISHDLDAPGLWVEPLELPEGYVGAVAGLSRRTEVRAVPLRRATRRTER